MSGLFRLDCFVVREAGAMVLPGEGRKAVTGEIARS